MMKRMTLGCMMTVCLLLFFATVLGEATALPGQALREELPYQVGDKSEVIRDIKEALFAVRGIHVQMQQPGEGDGEAFSAEYDREFEEAVLKYQKKMGFPETGVIDENMMEALLPRYYARIDAAAGGALVLGAISEDVKIMQENLRMLGYYNGDITGHIGEITESAIMIFQAAHGLPESGFADEKTLDAIKDAIEKWQGK